jgi:hypothetical protein
VRGFDQWERRFAPTKARANAALYSKELFQERFARQIEYLLEEKVDCLAE